MKSYVLVSQGELGGRLGIWESMFFSANSSLFLKNKKVLGKGGFPVCCEEKVMVGD